MDKHYTVMIVPKDGKQVRTIKIPRILFKGFVFLSVLIVFIVGILVYDYSSILKQVYQNRHLSIENKELKEQIQLFNMKINTLDSDLERIRVFEKKLRIISGLEDFPEYKQQANSNNSESPSGKLKAPKSSDNRVIRERDLSTSGRFKELKLLYEQKIAAAFGIQAEYSFTKEWNQLTKQTFELASNFAAFDDKYLSIKEYAEKLEIDIHELDQFLLDKESMMRSTPTLMPAQGWLTSFYGPRMSHYAKTIKMHEGIDMGGPIGSAIVATADGVVTYAGNKPGFGNTVIIDHGYGMETLYGHNKNVTVKSGQKVRRGDTVALLGNTGYSTGPHVHYEIRINKTPVDPLFFILQ